MSWLVIHESQMLFVAKRVIDGCFLREECPIVAFLLHRLQAQMPPIATDLHTLSNGLEVIVVLHKSLLGFLWAQLHEEGDVGLYVKRGNIERSICCRRDLNYEERVGSLDEMAAFIQHNSVDIQVCSLVYNCVTVTLARSWYRGIQALVASLLVITTEVHARSFLLRRVIV